MNALSAGVNPEVSWSAFRLQYALARFRIALKAYDPNQPRAPGGTEEAGQWISVNSDAEPITLAGGFNDEHMGNDGPGLLLKDVQRKPQRADWW